MNKWQIICPAVAVLVAGMVFGIVAVRGQHRGFITVASRSIGSDLIRATNSSHLVRIGRICRHGYSNFGVFQSD